MRLMHRLGILLACLMLPWCGRAMELTEDTIYDPIPVKGSAPYAPHQEAYLPEQTGYHDDSLDVRVETFRRHDTTVMAVYVRLMDPSQLRTALAAKPPSRKTVVVTTMARKNNAVLAINGDYFSFHQHGIVVRGGKMWRNRPDGKRDILIIDEKGDFTILPRCTAEDFAGYTGTVMHAFCFGPGLVVDGQTLTSLEHADVGNAPAKATQRIAIGQTGPLEYLILATEGPDNKGSEGFTILQMAELCQEMGCMNAYNLDGGSSSSVVLDGKKINALSTGKIRPVGDCIYFATLIP